MSPLTCEDRLQVELEVTIQNMGPKETVVGKWDHPKEIHTEIDKSLESLHDALHYTLCWQMS